MTTNFPHSVAVAVLIAPIDPIIWINEGDSGCKLMGVPNDMLRASQERPQADKKEDGKNHDDPSGQYLVPRAEMLELLLVVVGVEFTHVFYQLAITSFRLN